MTRRTLSLVRHYADALNPATRDHLATLGYTPEPADVRALIVTTLASLLVQGGPGYDAANSTCTYADPHGRHCAVGVWMHPRLAEAATPSASVTSVCSAYGWERVFGFAPIAGSDMENEALKVAVTLQAMHDTAAVASVEWPAALRAEFMRRAVSLGQDSTGDYALNADEAFGWGERVWADVQQAARAIAAEVHQ